MEFASAGQTACEKFRAKHNTTDLPPISREIVFYLPLYRTPGAAQTRWKRSSPMVCISVRGLDQTLRTWERRHPWSDLKPLTDRLGKSVSSDISLLSAFVRTFRERNQIGIVHRTQERKPDLVVRATVKQPCSLCSDPMQMKDRFFWRTQGCTWRPLNDRNRMIKHRTEIVPGIVRAKVSESREQRLPCDLPDKYDRCVLNTFNSSCSSVPHVRREHHSVAQWASKAPARKE